MKTLYSVAACALSVVLTAVAAGARLESGNTFRLPEGEAQVGDLYYGGSSLRLEGDVDGSVIAGAQTMAASGTITRNLLAVGQDIGVSGNVQGDIMVGCATFRLTGPVRGAVRVGAGSVTIASRVEQDVVAGCRSLAIEEGAEVRGDVVAGCGLLEVPGTVRGKIVATAGEVVISGIVDGDVELTVGHRLELTEEARVFGSLRYRSETELDIGNPDAVFGDIEFTRIEPRSEFDELRDFKPKPNLFAAFLLPFAIVSVLGALAVGFILVAIWQHALRQAVDGAIRRFGRAVGFGALGLLASPAALLIAFVLVITIPAGLIGTLLYLIALYLAKVLSGIFLGRWLFRILDRRPGTGYGPGPSMWLTTPVGILLVFALCAIPFAGWLIWLFALMVGFGVILELLAMSRRP